MMPRRGSDHTNSDRSWWEGGVSESEGGLSCMHSEIKVLLGLPGGASRRGRA